MNPPQPPESHVPYRGSSQTCPRCGSRHFDLLPIGATPPYEEPKFSWKEMFGPRGWLFREITGSIFAPHELNEAAASEEYRRTHLKCANCGWHVERQ